MAIRCPNCKSVIEDGAVYCRTCGFSVIKHSGAFERVNEPVAPPPANNVSVNHHSNEHKNMHFYPVQSPVKQPGNNNGYVQPPAYNNMGQAGNQPVGNQNKPMNYQAPQPGFQPAVAANMNGAAAPEKKNNKTLFIVLSVLGGVFVLVLAVVLISIFGGGSRDYGDYGDYNGGYDDVYGDSYYDSYDNIINDVDVDLGGNNVIDLSNHGNYNSDFYSYPNLPAVDPATVPERTIMIYIVGSDLESGGGCASIDINEMLESDFNEDKTNILICTGGSNMWYLPQISSNNNMIFEVTNGTLVEKQKNPAADMTDTATLSSFINYSVENYPADEYGIILWNHGCGPFMGYGYDEISGKIMLLEDMKSAFDAASFGSDKKFEFIGFDACLMASIETSAIFSDYADYMIASQEAEPGCGWEYSFLGQLDRCVTGEDVGKLIIDSYFAGCYELFADDPAYKTDITLSCVDLSQIDNIEESVGTLFAKVDEDINNGQFSTASRCRYQAKTFGGTQSNMSYDLVDLGHLNALLSATYGTQSADVEASLSEFVCYSKSNVALANGVSIYHPYDDKESIDVYIKYYPRFGFSDDYCKYIDDFSSILISGDSAAGNWKSFSKSSGSAEKNNNMNDLSMQLTPEQVKNFSGAKYHVFRALDPADTFSGLTEYLPVFSGYDVSIDENGVLSASYDGKAVFGIDEKTGEVSDMPLAMTQIYDGVNNNKYEFSCMFFSYGDDMADWQVEPVDWHMEIHNGVPILMGAYKMTSAMEGLPEKNQLDYNDYETYQFMNNSYTIETDSDGNVNFVSCGSAYGYEYSKEDGFRIECRDIEDKENYYVVFVVEDIYGNRYTSDFFSLPE